MTFQPADVEFVILEFRSEGARTRGDGCSSVSALTCKGRPVASPNMLSELLLSYRRQHYYYCCHWAFYNTFNNGEDDHDNRTDINMIYRKYYNIKNKQNLMNKFGNFLLSIL